MAGRRGRNILAAERGYSCKGFSDNRYWRPCYGWSN